MGSHGGVCGGSTADNNIGCVSGPASSSVQLQNVPSLAQLLGRTFLELGEDANTQRQKQMNGDGCSSNKRPKLVLVTPTMSQSPPSSPPPPEQTQKEKTHIFGIPNIEFQTNPGIFLAIRRLLTALETMFTRRYGHLSLNRLQLEDFKEDVEILKEEELKIATSLTEIEQLSMYTWEQLNVGHWKTVPRFWRKLYTSLKILKVSFMVIKSEPSLEIVKECDMGLLMGEPISDNVLSKIAEEISAIIIRKTEDIASTVSSIKTEVDPDEGNGSEASNTFTPVMTIKKEEIANFPLKNRTENEHQLMATHQPCLTEFKSYMGGSTPCLLQNIVDHWPAIKKWNVEYIQKIAGFRTVPVEIGQRYTSEDWTQKLMTISEFIEKYMKKEGTSKEDIGYIAQYTLFNQLPQLRQDIRIPDYCIVDGKSEESVEINGWFGPANTISPCHYDPKHNILVQVFGSKAIRLFPPSESSLLQPFPASTLLFNTSQLDVEAEDLFQNAPEMETAMHYDLMLEPGQALYIPPKWWHYVKSLSPSFSVSFWFE